jgi:hypothetical protein
MGRKTLPRLNLLKNIVPATYNEVTTPEEKKRISFSITDLPEAEVNKGASFFFTLYETLLKD